MTKVFLLYIGNAWLMRDSLRLIAVCTTIDRAEELAARQLNLTDEQLAFLRQSKQTQGLNENAYIQPADVDIPIAD